VKISLLKDEVFLLTYLSRLRVYYLF